MRVCACVGVRVGVRVGACGSVWERVGVCGGVCVSLPWHVCTCTGTGTGVCGSWETFASSPAAISASRPSQPPTQRRTSTARPHLESEKATQVTLGEPRAPPGRPTAFPTPRGSNSR